MKTIWTTGLDPKTKKEIEDDFKSCPLLRERLSAILSKKIDSLRDSTVSKDAYASPSWAYLQADAVGYERAMKEVISLLMAKND